MKPSNILHIGDDASTKTECDTLTVALNGSHIHQGSRNIILTKVAGKLHDGTRTLDQLIRDLMAVNKARCEPPLPFSEVRDIAKSIHKRLPCRPSKGKPPQEVIDFVSRHWMGVLAAGSWKGQGGGSEYKVYEALLDVAQHHGWITKHGYICVSVSVRDLAMRAGVSQEACRKALKRLQKQRLIYRVPSVTKGTAGRLILRDVLKGLPQELYSQSAKHGSPLSVQPLRELLSTEDFATVAAGSRRRWCCTLMRALLFSDEGASVSWISRVLDRRPDNVRRTLKLLEEREIVEQVGEDYYRVATDLLPVLLEALNEDGVPDTERAQRQRDDNQREAYYGYLRRQNSSKSKREGTVPSVPNPLAWSCRSSTPIVRSSSPTGCGPRTSLRRVRTGSIATIPSAVARGATRTLPSTCRQQE